jgi:hypothetical protein
MHSKPPRYSKDEHARRGKEVYERDVRDKVELIHKGQIAAIDVDTGAFEVADDGLTAANRLLVRKPDAQIWCVKIGYPAVHRFGPRTRAAHS